MVYCMLYAFYLYLLPVDLLTAFTMNGPKRRCCLTHEAPKEGRPGHGKIPSAYHLCSYGITPSAILECCPYICKIICTCAASVLLALQFTVITSSSLPSLVVSVTDISISHGYGDHVPGPFGVHDPICVNCSGVERNPHTLKARLLCTPGLLFRISQIPSGLSQNSSL